MTDKFKVEKIIIPVLLCVLVPNSPQTNNQSVAQRLGTPGLMFTKFVWDDEKVLEMGMDKKAVVYLHKRILLDHTKKGNITFCNSMSDCGEHYAK